MATEAPPSSSRKTADSASRRRWNGRSGRPSGNTIAAGGASMAYPATMASASATAAPTGNSARLMKRRSRGRTSPSAPMASHATIAAMTRDSGVAVIAARARQRPRGGRRAVRARSLDPHSGLRAGIG